MTGAFENTEKKRILPLDALILISIVLQTVWAATQGFVFNFDGMGRVPITLLSISFAAALIFYRPYLKKIRLAMLVWGLWVFYTIINTVGHGWQADEQDKALQLFYLVIHWFYFSLIAIMLQKFNNLTTKALIGSLLIICLLYNIFGNWVLTRGNFNRFYSDVINANEFAYVALTLIALLIYDMECRRRIWWKLLLAAYAVILLLNTGSRTALFAMLPLIFIPGWNILRKKCSPLKAFGLSLLVLSIILPPMLAFSEKIVTVQRIADQQTEMELLDLDDTLLVNRLLGDRAIHYTEGLAVWQEAPIFGIGHSNFVNYSSRRLRSHIEYMAQLSEGGIVGFSLYMWFLLLLCNVLRNMQSTPEQKALQMMTFAFLLAMLIFNIGLFTTNQNTFYIYCAYLSLGLYRPWRPGETPPDAENMDQSTPPGNPL